MTDKTILHGLMLTYSLLVNNLWSYPGLYVIEKVLAHYLKLQYFKQSEVENYLGFGTSEFSNIVFP